MSNIVYIYALCDPDTEEIRYVGKTINLKKRLADHLNPSALKSACYKVNWIKGLIKENKKPLIKVIEEVTKETWVEREIYWIAYYRRLGSQLTNTLGGGNGREKGFKPSPESIAKSAAGNRGKKASDETRKKMSEVRKGVPYSEKAVEARKLSMQRWWDTASPEELRRQKEAMRLGVSKEGREEATKKRRLHPPKGKYKGVVKNGYGRYEASANANYKQYYLGTFSTAEEAAVARDLKSVELLGRDIYLNFPSNVLVQKAVVIKHSKILSDEEVIIKIQDLIKSIHREPQRIRHLKASPNTNSGFKGVYKKEYHNRVKYFIHLDGTQSKGYYIAEEAAVAYDKKVVELYGTDVYLNFPDNPEVKEALEKYNEQ